MIFVMECLPEKITALMVSPGRGISAVVEGVERYYLRDAIRSCLTFLR